MAADDAEYAKLRAASDKLYRLWCAVYGAGWKAGSLTPEAVGRLHGAVERADVEVRRALQAVEARAAREGVSK